MARDTILNKFARQKIYPNFFTKFIVIDQKCRTLEIIDMLLLENFVCIYKDY